MSEVCAFCDRSSWAWRTVREGDLFVSFMSNPRFREGHCLVVPKRHIVRAAELREAESSALMAEIGRVADKVDAGYGTGVMQKYQPAEPDGSIKVSHLHFHVFPRRKEESGLFPVPEPNSFDGFETAERGEIIAQAERLK